MKNTCIPTPLFDWLASRAQRFYRSIPSSTYDSNGCTGVPDLCFGPACHFHDNDYDEGGNEADRSIADSMFLEYMDICRLYYDKKTWFYWLVARKYYYGVRVAGFYKFSYDEGKEPSIWTKLPTFLLAGTILVAMAVVLYFALKLRKKLDGD